MKYFISDLHLFDDGIIYYCGRPFASADEMNAVLVDNVRNTLRDGDELFLLGDIVGMKGGIEMCGQILKEMGVGGTVPFHLILGNHDLLTEDEYLKMGFAAVERIGWTEIAGHKAMLAHDPCMVQPVGTLAVCGHIHTLFSEIYNEERNTLTINVSVERRGYRPVSEAELSDIIKNSKWRAE